MSLRTKLIFVFLAATLAPLAVMVWVTLNLLETSLRYTTTVELDEISRSLETTGREVYQQAREALKAEAAANKLPARKFAKSGIQPWPAHVALFAASGERERFLLSGEEGDRLDYLVARKDGEVWVYSHNLGGIGMNRLSQQFTRARNIVNQAGSYDLRRGFTLTLLFAAGVVYVVALALLIWIAIRVSRPMRTLQQGLQTLASGDFGVRLQGEGADEAGQAIAAFNATAEQLEQSRENLIQLTRVASWQTLARKMAHEVKNSLTPIRLTMEEITARNGSVDAPFLRQASQIVADEVTTLEKRVRAFSDFAAEPPAHPQPTDLNALVEERVAFLKPMHPGIVYSLHLAPSAEVHVDPDLLRGVLTNLFENAAQATGPGGRIDARTFHEHGRVVVEVADSGPGLTPLARSTLFEPSISFKKNGMGLGLSIARRSVLLCGGDIQHRDRPEGGAAFRVALPAIANGRTDAPHLDT